MIGFRKNEKERKKEKDEKKGEKRELARAANRRLVFLGTGIGEVGENRFLDVIDGTRAINGWRTRPYACCEEAYSVGWWVGLERIELLS